LVDHGSGQNRVLGLAQVDEGKTKKALLAFFAVKTYPQGIQWWIYFKHSRTIAVMQKLVLDIECVLPLVVWLLTREPCL